MERGFIVAGGASELRYIIGARVEVFGGDFFGQTNPLTPGRN